MALQLAQLLFSMLSTIPAIQADVEAALAQHWGQDHVAQAKMAVALLQKIVNDLEAGMNGGSISPQASPQMGPAV
jgi:hypothetical protein